MLFWQEVAELNAHKLLGGQATSVAWNVAFVQGFKTMRDSFEIHPFGQPSALQCSSSAAAHEVCSLGHVSSLVCCPKSKNAGLLSVTISAGLLLAWLVVQAA